MQWNTLAFLFTKNIVHNIIKKEQVINKGKGYVGKSYINYSA